MHVARRQKSLYANIDPFNACVSRRDRGRNQSVYHTLLLPANILIDPIAQTLPYPLKKIAPSQLLHKPKHLLKTVSAPQQIRPHHTCRNHPARYVRTQFGYTARHIISGFTISLHINGGQQRCHLLWVSKVIYFSRHRLLILLLEMDFCRLQ